MLHEQNNRSPYLIPDEIAERLRVPVKTIYSWLRGGRLRGSKFGKFWRVLRSDFQQFERENLQDKEAE